MSAWNEVKKRTNDEPYTWQDLQIFAWKVAGQISRRYDSLDITYDDANNEALLWAYDHKAKVEGWLAASPQRTTRIFRSMLDHVTSYAEKQKANRLGYDPSDVTWYSPALVEGLLPLALDDTYAPEFVNDSDGVGRSNKPMNERGDLLTMVMDVRRAVSKVGVDVERIVNYLGGQRPNSRRRVVTNASAQAQTQDDY